MCLKKGCFVMFEKRYTIAYLDKVGKDLCQMWTKLYDDADSSKTPGRWGLFVNAWIEYVECFKALDFYKLPHKEQYETVYSPDNVVLDFMYSEMAAQISKYAPMAEYDCSDIIRDLYRMHLAYKDFEQYESDADWYYNNHPWTINIPVLDEAPSEETSESTGSCEQAKSLCFSCKYDVEAFVRYKAGEGMDIESADFSAISAGKPTVLGGRVAGCLKDCKCWRGCETCVEYADDSTATPDEKQALKEQFASEHGYELLQTA